MAKNLQRKDLITICIYTAIYFAIMLAVITPIMQILMPAPIVLCKEIPL